MIGRGFNEMGKREGKGTRGEMKGKGKLWGR